MEPVYGNNRVTDKMSESRNDQWDTMTRRDNKDIWRVLGEIITVIRDSLHETINQFGEITFDE